MSAGRHRLRLTAQQRLAALFLAAAVLVGAPLALLATSFSRPAEAAVGTYDNAAIADKAMSYVNRPFGQACRDAGVDRADGQCRSFVNCVIFLASGRQQRTGQGWPDYFVGFERAGGQRIYDVNQLAKGDVVQQGRTEAARLHTYIILSRQSGNVFSVVDSNSDRRGVVMGGANHVRTVALSDGVRAYRMGTVRNAPPPPPQQPSSPQRPVYSVMNTSEQPPDGVWFRDNPNVSGPRLNGFGVYRGDQVQLQCWGWGPTVGSYDNRLWYRAANLTRPNAPGRPNVGFLNAHFVNDGQRSNIAAPGVPTC